MSHLMEARVLLRAGYVPDGDVYRRAGWLGYVRWDGVRWCGIDANGVERRGRVLSAVLRDSGAPALVEVPS